MSRDDRNPESPPPTDRAPGRRPLRLWPGVVLVALQWLARFVLPAIAPDVAPYAAMFSLFAGLLLLVWWAFFSRAPHLERWGGIAWIAAAFFLTSRWLHVSVATGAMGLLFPLYAVPTVCLAFVAWALLLRNSTDRKLRWLTMAAAVLIGCGGWALVRTGGFTGGIDSDFAWRWAQTPEERLLASADTASVSAAAAASPAAAIPATVAEWPGFRGPARDGAAAGVRIASDWSASPPAELWRRPVGPGWSSFAVQGGRIYTQEQRGEEEVVSCYSAASGEPVWRHRDTARFWESNAGAGPRGTPTVAGGRVYAFGGTGIVNVLDASSGAPIWSRNAADDTGAELPDWGFSSSPLVIDDLVVVAASSILVAYDRETGEPRWQGPGDGGTSYSSPHLATLDGVRQVVQMRGDGVIGVAPADGSVLWRHDWSGYPIVQPALTAGGGLLVSSAQDSGLRSLAVTRGGSAWTVEEQWTSRRLKPYFNDFVVHRGHAYGFDGRILASIDLATGERDWKGGRYGSGQLVLLPDQDALLVISEGGELALVAATPDGYRELAKAPGIEGKTWNHPVVVGDLLLVRNAEEMAAFRLPAG